MAPQEIPAGATEIIVTLPPILVADVLMLPVTVIFPVVAAPPARISTLPAVWPPCPPVIMLLALIVSPASKVTVPPLITLKVSTSPVVIEEPAVTITALACVPLSVRTLPTVIDSGALMLTAPARLLKLKALIPALTDTELPLVVMTTFPPKPVGP